MAEINKLNTADRVQNQLQDNFSNALKPIMNNPIINGSILSSIALKTGKNLVSHKLGRQLTGWIITRLRKSATLYDDGADDKILTLYTSADVTVDLYVF